FQKTMKLCFTVRAKTTFSLPDVYFIIYLPADYIGTAVKFPDHCLIDLFDILLINFMIGAVMQPGTMSCPAPIFCHRKNIRVFLCQPYRRRSTGCAENHTNRCSVQLGNHPSEPAKI